MKDFEKIPGYERYAIYRSGAVVNLDTGRELKKHGNSKNYVCLFKSGTPKEYFVPKLMKLLEKNENEVGKI